ncbi:Creatine kinase [Durusdinium trenchii]|uniref:Testis isozyme n=1 Tax=Durusdinium trenchii TaxID=1381693 RepID=A0ABP0IGJ4_9DINO
MNVETGLPFASLPGLGEDELPGFSAEECPEELPDLSKHFSLAAEVLKSNRNLYQQMRTQKTPGGVSFAKCIKTGIDNRGHPMIKAVGAVAGDADCFETFKPFFDQVLVMCHGEESLSRAHASCPPRSMALALELPPEQVVACHLRISRNLKDFPFAPQMQRAQRSEVEQRIVSTLLARGGSYFPLVGSRSYAAKPNGMDLYEEKMLLDSNLLFREPDSPAVLSSGTGRHWPDGRGVFVFATGVSAWINEEDHFRLMLDRKDGNLKQALTDADAVLGVLESVHGFAQSERLGYLTSSPMNVGVAMDASFELRLPELMSAKKELVEWCKARDLIARAVLDEQGLRVEGLLEVSHRRRIGIRPEEVVAELVQEAAFLCRAERLAAGGLSGAEALGAIQPRELTPIGVEDEEALAQDAWDMSGGHIGMLISNAMIMEEVEAAKVKLAQSLMAGTLGDLLTTRAMQYQQERQEEFERQKAEAAAKIQAIQRGRQERAKAKPKPKKQQQFTKEELEERKSLLRDALEVALNDGTLEKVLMESQNPLGAVDQLRLRARGDLERAAMDGRLVEVLNGKRQVARQAAEGPAELRLRAREHLTAAATDGRLEQVLEAKERQKQLEQQKAEAAAKIQAIQRGRQDRAKAKAKPREREAEDSVRELRARVGEQLVAAAEDGRCARGGRRTTAGAGVVHTEALEKASLVDELRTRVGQQLLEAADDGRLEEALSKKVGDQRLSGGMESLRFDAGRLLLSAAEDGRLEDVLRAQAGREPAIEPASERTDALRVEVGQKLLRAAEDGSFELRLKAQARGARAAAGKVMEASAAGEELRVRVGQQLMDAAADGRLEEALRREAKQPIQVERMESVRRKAAERLLAAAEATWDGRLERALAHDDMEAVRVRLATNLLAAAEDDGRLGVALSHRSDLSPVRQCVAARLLAAAEDGRMEQELGQRAAQAS